jgi:hypothetical protein
MRELRDPEAIIAIVDDASVKRGLERLIWSFVNS